MEELVSRFLVEAIAAGAVITVVIQFLRAQKGERQARKDLAAQCHSSAERTTATVADALVRTNDALAQTQTALGESTATMRDMQRIVFELQAELQTIRRAQG